MFRHLVPDVRSEAGGEWRAWRSGEAGWMAEEGGRK